MVSPARLAAELVRIYQWFVSPLLGAHCRFAPSCSEYARLALLEHGLIRGAWLALRRLARCHPFHPGGVDPPPARAHTR
ncbi:MAG TPA: membrane protein insertion efficiency factor YidD [Candidatus Binatia bacterium]|nr:membrane protein insertion efficiency factor YidD [Candidatus Binatia bacterium]